MDYDEDDKPKIGIGPRSTLFISTILVILTVGVFRFVTEELSTTLEQASNVTKKLGGDVVERGQEIASFYGEHTVTVNGSFLALAILLIVGVELWYLHRGIHYLEPLYKKYSKERVNNDLRRINTYLNMHPELSKRELAAQLQKQGWSRDIVDAALRKSKKKHKEYRIKLRYK